MYFQDVVYLSNFARKFILDDLLKVFLGKNKWNWVDDGEWNILFLLVYYYSWERFWLLKSTDISVGWNLIMTAKKLLKICVWVAMEMLLSFLEGQKFTY